MPTSHEAYISVDVETAGPNPGRYSLLAIGACTLAEPSRTFYIELQPVNAEMLPEAYAVHGLALEDLAVRGVPPAAAQERVETWLVEVVPPGAQPVCVAFNAPFDWMFVCDYFQRFLGRNPLGHSALDIKAFYMGLTGSAWEETGMSSISSHYGIDRPLTHHALQDAIDQAGLFRRMLSQAAGGKG